MKDRGEESLQLHRGCKESLESYLNYDSANKLSQEKHYVKSVPLRSYSGSYFPAFGLNAERYGVPLCIQSECGKIRTRITPNTGTFHAVEVYCAVVYFLGYDNNKQCWVMVV